MEWNSKYIAPFLTSGMSDTLQTVTPSVTFLGEPQTPKTLFTRQRADIFWRVFPLVLIKIPQLGDR